MLHLLQTALIYLGSFFVVLSVVVTVHELGHFYAARLCRIPVKSFSLGFGPQLAAVKDRHGTVWKLSAVPLGGFVSWIDDTDPTSTLPSSEEVREIEPGEARRRGYFRAQPIWARAFVTAAGPLSNFIFAIFAFSLLAMIGGHDVTDVSRIPARISAIAPHSAASTVGLKAGDVIVSADGHAIGSFIDLQRVVSASAGRELQLQVKRGGDTLTIAATPGVRAGATPPQGVLGVNGPLILPSEQVIARVGPVEALTFGATHTWDIVAMTGDYIVKVFTGRAQADQIAGPLGILSASGQVATASLSNPTPPGVPGGQLSVAVGFVNILPIPVLDGGHLLFYAIEAVRGGRPLPVRAQEVAFWTGVSVLVSLFLFATWNDITKHLPELH